MKPESLLGILIELIERLAEPGPLPADARVGKYAREKSFLGSRDRRFVTEAAYGWLRHLPRVRSPLGPGAFAGSHKSVGGAPRPEPTSAYLADVLALARERLFPWSFEETMAAARGYLEARGAESSRAEALARAWEAERAGPSDPLARFGMETSLPEWLARCLVEERGIDRARKLAQALLEPAPVDLRVRLSRLPREEARRRLEEELGQRVTTTPWSPWGLRLERRARLGGTRTFREGSVEIEDEGSQLVVLALEATPGMTVVDFCAGAGGKSLALAEALGGQGVVACDVEARRLAELERRARRAGLEHDIRCVVTEPAGPLPTELQPADLVFVDAPCSGLGTLRRNPELKLRHGPEDVLRFSRLQLTILERCLPLVRPGGQLAYATCSLLAEENEDVVHRFAAAHPELCPRESQWARSHLPSACSEDGFLRLDPPSTGTDGFFLAMWTRRSSGPP